MSDSDLLPEPSYCVGEDIREKEYVLSAMLYKFVEISVQDDGCHGVFSPEHLPDGTRDCGLGQR